MADLYRDRHLSGRIDRELRTLRSGVKLLHGRPEQISDVLVQIKRLLPAEGYLTQRMAQLRQTAYQVRKGHIARMLDRYGIPFFYRRPTIVCQDGQSELWKPAFTLPSYGGFVVDHVPGSGPSQT